MLIKLSTQILSRASLEGLTAIKGPAGKIGLFWEALWKQDAIYI